MVWTNLEALRYDLIYCEDLGDESSNTTPIIHALLKMYQEEWEELGWAMSVHSMCSVMFLLVASLGGIRGYEVVWTDLGTLRYDLLYYEDLGDESSMLLQK